MGDTGTRGRRAIWTEGPEPRRWPSHCPKCHQKRRWVKYPGSCPLIFNQLLPLAKAGRKLVGKGAWEM